MNFKRTKDEVSFSRRQGRILHDARVAREMTREQLAERSGVHHQRIFRIEMGDSTARAYDLALIAEVLEVPLACLFPAAEESRHIVMLEPERAFA